MGGCLSLDLSEEALQNSAIERMLEDDRKQLARESKILLLGTGESGKSTVVKQMKIIHQKGYTHEELLNFRPIIFRNVLECTSDLMRGYERLQVEPELERNKVFMAEFMRIEDESAVPTELSPELVDSIDNFWRDPAYAQKMKARSNEFYLMDSAPYFFDDIRRIGAPDYVPDVHDVLRSRTKTTGIVETRFQTGQLSIHMFDVGGQRSERRKWIHCFESVTSIIFCVAISEYDQMLLEEVGQNRLKESLSLFEGVINSRWFTRTSMILFLNKIDIFMEKITRVPLSKYFEEYTGGEDYEKASKFIVFRFSQKNRQGLFLYPHMTQATDTSNIRLVFAAVKETILQNALRDSGIL